MKEHIRLLENTLIYKGPLERAAFVTYFGMGWACTGGFKAVVSPVIPIRKVM